MTGSRHTALRNAVEGLPLPLAWVDLAAFDANARTLVSRAGGKPIRLASKSVRCRALMRRVLDGVAGFAGILAYSAREAAFLARDGFADVVVAYPTTVPADIEAATRAGVTLTVDCVEHVRAHAAIARRLGQVLRVAIDVDASTDLPGLRFGVYRSPLRTARQALAVTRAILAEPSLHLDGLIAYEAQIAGIRDARPDRRLEGLLYRVLKHRSMAEVVERRAAVVDAVRHEAPLRFVNGGGTGSLRETSADPSVTELAAGSGLFAPTLFDGYRDLHLEPAAGFALPIARIAAKGIYTCLGGGYVASGPSGEDRLPTPILPHGARLLPHEGAGEVQTPVAYDGDVPLGLGDPVFFRHAKAGELCERFDSVIAFDGAGRVAVTTYRGDGQTFL